MTPFVPLFNCGEYKLYAADKDLNTRSARLTLPASVHEMTDVLEQVSSEKMEDMYFEIEKHYKGEYLADVLESNITLPELNILARRIAEMDEGQEAILEGLVKMESRKQGTGQLPYLKLLQLTENTDCCHLVYEARNDRQLGRFYAENGFVEGVDDLPDKLFELLDFEKIGRETRLAEGGVFTEDSGYVVRHTELRELTEVPDLGFRNPLYTLLLEFRLEEDENDPVLRLALPTTEERIRDLEEKYPPDEHIIRCTDCAIPFFCGCVEEKEVALHDLNEFARMMDFALARGELSKYKAILLATGCRDAAQAAEFGKHRSMEEYRFLPYQGENRPEEYAAGWLKKKLGRDAAGNHYD